MAGGARVCDEVSSSMSWIDGIAIHTHTTAGLPVDGLRNQRLLGDDWLLRPNDRRRVFYDHLGPCFSADLHLEIEIIVPIALHDDLLSLALQPRIRLADQPAAIDDRLAIVFRCGYDRLTDGHEFDDIDAALPAFIFGNSPQARQVNSHASGSAGANIFRQGRSPLVLHDVQAGGGTVRA